ncbi:MAG TPA: hypothetical protein VFM35_06950 [Candidatus Binatia bacterium]|nr:hypothetical protein [Candidatus Binatia bacterium]
MKHLKSPVLVFVITIVVSACGGQPLPTMDPADVQLTTVAGVLTGLAQTQSAVPTATVPTATPLPPTETGRPTALPASASQTPVLLTTLTSLPTLPTLQATSTTAPVITAGPDPCLSTKKGIPYPPAGRPTIIRIINSNQTTVNVTLYLNKTPHGECGYRAYIINSLSEITITNLVQGCYNLWAWSNDPSRPVNAASKLSCINSPDKWTFRITADKIKFLDL